MSGLDENKVEYEDCGAEATGEDMKTSSQDEYVPDGAAEQPERFTQHELNDLIRDLSLTNDKVELLASRLKQKNLLHDDVKRPPGLAAATDLLRLWNYKAQLHAGNPLLCREQGPLESVDFLPPSLPSECRVPGIPRFILIVGAAHKRVLAGRNDGGLCWMKDEGLHLETSLIRELMRDNVFEGTLNDKELRSWKSSTWIYENFLGKKKSPEYVEDVEELLNAYQCLGSRMSLKMHLSSSHMFSHPALMSIHSTPYDLPILPHLSPSYPSCPICFQSCTISVQHSAPSLSSTLPHLCPALCPISVQHSAPSLSSTLPHLCPALCPISVQHSAPSLSSTLPHLCPALCPISVQHSAPSLSSTLLSLCPALCPISVQHSAPSLSSTLPHLCPALCPISVQHSAPSLSSTLPHASTTEYMDFRKRDKTWINQLGVLFGEKSGSSTEAGEVKDLKANIKNLLKKRTKVWWNKVSLETYLQRYIIPRGLRIQIYPTAECDPLFTNKWEDTLSKCSRTLLELLIGADKKKLEHVEGEIDALKSKIQTSLTADECSQFDKEVETELAKWEKEIQSQKIRKFHRDQQDYEQKRIYRWQYNSKKRDRTIVS
ncbi:unnamed protein product [Ranitomeya imitator]|uniref:Uncharacterized protein n=1 Tax=Ranitomeya imitator TaxID=111125 RepID=A0ABN9M748_9NEOB|nr:unnamed protein product [Ranitomeya imitator]